MGTIFTLIGALLPFVVTELQQFKVVSPELGALITGIEGAAAAFTSQLTNSSSGAVSVTAVGLLTGISAAVTVLQTQTGVSPQGLAITKAFSVAVTAGLAAADVTSVDPTKLQPIAPLV